jgi:hypothetical protein
VKPKIRIKIDYAPGYGGPATWYVSAIWKNVLLDSKTVYSEMSAGETNAKFRAKWERVWAEPAWDKKISHKKPASELCAHCGCDTIDGSISCVGKVFCKKCERFIEQYKKEYRERLDADSAAFESERKQQEQTRRADVDSKLRGFHWSDGYYFLRASSGGVVVRHFQLDGHYLDLELEIPENEWASIVCSVSALGETGERWQQAREFHGAVAIERSPTQQLQPQVPQGRDNQVERELRLIELIRSMTFDKCPYCMGSSRNKHNPACPIEWELAIERAARNKEPQR